MQKDILILKLPGQYAPCCLELSPSFSQRSDISPPIQPVLPPNMRTLVTGVGVDMIGGDLCLIAKKSKS